MTSSSISLDSPTSAESHIQASRTRTMVAIALVSFASLLLELGLTRLFSVVLFYHFAFLAISVALLGLGAGGVFAYLQKDWLEKWSSRQLGQRLCAANAVVTLLVLEIVLHLPISLELTRGNFAKLTVLYLASAVPFFFTGLLFSVVFARETKGIGSIYASDLFGGALACMAIVPLLNFIGGPNAILFSSVMMAAAAALWAETKRSKTVSIWLTASFALLIAANFSGKLIDIVYAKGKRRDQPWMLFAKWNAISRIEVDNVDGARYVVIDADASTAIMNVDPAKWDVDGKLSLKDNGNPPVAGYNWKKDLMSAAPAVANVLRPHGKFAIIGPGGGVDVMRAVANGSKDVTGIEINPIIANTVMRGNHADYSYHLYERPEVHIHVADGRSWIRNSKEQYDVVQMTLVDTWASTAAGAFALSENNLYTVEAFEEYFQHLKPDGFIAITRWEFKEPREALRVVSQATTALRRLGEQRVDLNIAVVSDGNLDEDGRPVTVLVKRAPFSHREASSIACHLFHNKNLKPLYIPYSTLGYRAAFDDELIKRSDAALNSLSMPTLQEREYKTDVDWGYPCWDEIAKVVPKSWLGHDDPLNIVLMAPFGSGESSAKYDELPALADFQKAVETGSNHPQLEFIRQEFWQTYPYNIAPVYDKNPFFFFTMKTGHVLKQVLAGTGKGMDWRINLGITVLFMVFAISIVAVLAFLILPLWLHNPRDAAGPSSRLFYFIAVGLGFILVEIALIQRFVLFLGHPTYALTVVVFLMLLSSGAGSFISRQWLKQSSSVRVPLLAIAVGIVAYVYALPVALSSMIGLPFAVKLLVSGAMIVPLGFAMGMPFPTGLRALSELGDNRVEWAWAMNAAASVLGSVSAMIIAIHFGLNVTLLCGAAAYFLAMMLVGSFKSSNQQSALSSQHSVVDRVQLRGRVSNAKPENA